jgi:hypothetical protein
MTAARAWLAVALIGSAAVTHSTPLFAQASPPPDVSGKWSFTVTTDAGTGTPTVTLKQQGDSLTGHYSSQLLGERALKGSVKGNTITFTFAADAQGTAFTVTYAGTVEGSAMKGTVDLGGAASGTFTAKRQ